MISDQNSTENLHLLAAQRQIYLWAKKIGKIRFGGSLAFAVAGPWAASYCTASSIWILLSSTIFWPIVVELLKARQKTLASRAATIQEEFDANLFGLPWNYILVGNKIAKEIVLEADREYKGDRKGLQNWYTDIPQVKDASLNILLQQRANLLWDRRLRIKYARLLTLTITIILTFEIGFCIYTKKMLLDFLIQFIAPSMSLFFLGIENILTHCEIAAQKKHVENYIMSIYEKANNGEVAVSVDKECRQVQDVIYSTRKQNVMVPDFWSNRLHNSFQINMEEAAREYRIFNPK